MKVAVIVLAVLVVGLFGIIAGILQWIGERVRFDKDDNLHLKNDVYINSEMFNDGNG